MSSPKQLIVRDLVEEAKKRIVFLLICVVGLSYLMSLTSSSVLVNLPAAAFLIISIRYMSLDFEMKRKSSTFSNKSGSTNPQLSKELPDSAKLVDKSEWRTKVNSPLVEDAIDHFNRHLISEWVTDLWYSRITPDREGPEELVYILNSILGEIAGRVRNINLIDLLTRDLVNLICTHLEGFRAAQAKIEKQHSGLLTIEERDMELRLVLAAENKLHPALFSAVSEHKVLQHIMEGLISFIFKPEDLQCSFFRYMSRELLACAVMRPVLNLASPRFINERIESIVINRSKAIQEATSSQEASHPRMDGSIKISSDHFSRFLDPSVTGVELVPLKSGQSRAETENNVNKNISKDPLLSMDTQSSQSWGSLSPNTQAGEEQNIQRRCSGGQWGDMLDDFSRKKTQALAPENIENTWTKGRNYRKKEGENQSMEQVPQNSSAGKSLAVDHMNVKFMVKDNETISNFSQSKDSGFNSELTNQFKVENPTFLTDQNGSKHSLISSYEENEHTDTHMEIDDSGSNTSYTSEEETSNVTGLDAPGTKVWDRKSNRNQSISHIHHPLEISDVHVLKTTRKGHHRYQRIHKTQSGRKRSRSRSNSQNVHVWKEIERTSFLSGDGQDILSYPKEHVNDEDSGDDPDIENIGRIHSGAAASSAPSICVPESHTSTVNSLKSSMAVDSFLKLRCEVLGANIVKSGSRTVAVYSISVADVSNNNWSIKRRFRHFEELHRRLKEFPEYNLHLPPKHFLSTGLDEFVIQERCKLLDKYLKNLMQLPTVSKSIEVWDFLCVDSQTYVFSNSFSIIETLSVNLEDKPSEKTYKASSNLAWPVSDSLPSRKEHLINESKDSAFPTRNNFDFGGSKLYSKDATHMAPKMPGKESGLTLPTDTGEQRNSSSPKNLGKTIKGKQNDGLHEVSDIFHDSSDSAMPTEWVPPNVSVPIFDLVDVIFQLQDGGWIRRKAFWVAKQILQLGMGDAFDDWLIDKIQLLRKGSVVAAGIRRVEQILWPDGIFLTKHPKRRPPSSIPSPNLPHGQPMGTSSPRLDEAQQQEAARRAKFVYELMIDRAPPTIVGIVGHKEYKHCAKDLYFFLQSSVCLKLLAYDLLELLLLLAFPEMDYVIKQLHEEKHRFGDLK